MSRIFLSHSSTDELEAVGLAHWLSANGWDDVFLDVDGQRGLVAGERWQQALRRAADRCEAVLFIVTPAWAKSKWCLAEFLLAKSLNKLIFGVVLKEVAISELPAEMTSEWQLCHLAGSGPSQTIRFCHREQMAEVNFLTDGLKRLNAGLQAAGLRADYFPWPPSDDGSRSPYRGLEPLDAPDAAVFFGRDAEVLQALDKLRGMRAAGNEGLFVILGASGAGKSSFLRAGLLPRLARDQRHFWALPVLRPERNPLSGGRGLAFVLAKAQSALSSIVLNPGDVKAALGDTLGFRTLLRTLQDAAQASLVKLPHEAAMPTLVLPVDQAEELFSAQAALEGRRFLRLVGDVQREATESERRAPLIVVFTIRSDRFEPLQTAPELAGLKTVVFDALRPMPAAQFKEIIVGPANRARAGGRGVQFQPELVAQLLEDCARGADTLPLLSLTLARLYKDYGADGDLRLDEYRRMGGMADVIDSEAESILSADPDVRREQLDALHAAFIPWLATINPEDDQPVRRIARLSDLPPASLLLVQALIEKRLLLSDSRNGEPIVEVAHESLLRHWNSLVEWLRVERDDLKEADRLEQASTAWIRHSRKSDWLYEGERLTISEVLAAKPAYRRRLQNVSDFLQTSRQREDQRRAEEERARQAELDAAREKQLAAEALAVEQQRAAAQARADAARLRTRGRQILGFAAAAIALAVLGGWFAWQANRQSTLAQRQLLQASALQFNSEAQAMLLGTRAGGQLLGLLKLLAAHRLAPHIEIEGAMSAQVSDLEMLDKVFDCGSEAEAVAFSPDGARIVIGGLRSGLRLWDARTGMPVSPPFGEEGAGVWCVAYSPDGTRIASAHDDGIVRMWDAASRRRIGAPLQGHRGLVRAIAFSPDGSLLVSGGADRTMRLWDVASGKQLGEVPAHADSVHGVAFSPDGARIVTGSNDNTLRLWNAATGQPVGQPMRGHHYGVTSVAFDRSGTRIVSASLDGTLRVWDAANGKPVGEPFRGHDDWVNSVAFSPDGERIVSASNDKTVRIWDAKTGLPAANPLRGHEHWVTGAAFSPDGKRIVSASVDRTVRIWFTGVTRPIMETQGEEGCMLRVAVSPDNTRIASSGDCETLRLWDVGNARPISGPASAGGGTTSIAYSPNGRVIVTGDSGNGVSLWDAATLLPIVARRKEHQDRVNAVAFSPDGQRIASGSADRTVRLWDAATGVPVGVPMSGHQGEVVSVAFSPEGEHILSGSNDGVLRLWDAKSGRPAGELATAEKVESFAFSPGGSLIVTGGISGALRVWDLKTRRPVGAPMSGHRGAVRALGFSPDGMYIASGGADLTLRFWAAVTGQPIGPPLKGHKGLLSSVTFNRDGTLVVSGSDDLTIRIWPAPKAWPDVLCAKLSANLSRQQWRVWISALFDYRPQCPGLPIPPDNPLERSAATPK